jgi:diguanylate cyclase (GGDEF)-like protein
MIEVVKMFSLGVSTLIYAISKEIGKRYSSNSFKRIAMSSVYGIAFALLASLFYVLKLEHSYVLECASYLLLWLGISHFWGAKWENWLIWIASVFCVITLLLSFFLGRIFGEVLILLAGVLYTFFAIRNIKSKSFVPVPVLLSICVLLLLNILFANSIWFGWTGILFLYALIARIIIYLHAIYHRSITDRLTGLYNRTTFLEYVNEFLKNGKQIGVIFLDIDNFKHLNDTAGHEAGDKALKSVAEVLQESVKGIGVAARYGGEEMVAAVIDKDVLSVAEEIRQKIINRAGVTASIGVSISYQGIDSETLINKADDAMYQAKRNGKNRVVIM